MATKFQARVLAAIPTVTAPCGPTDMVAADPGYIALALDTSTTSVTRALRALESLGLVRNLGPIPGLTVDGWDVQ